MLPATTGAKVSEIFSSFQFNFSKSISLCGMIISLSFYGSNKLTL